MMTSLPAIGKSNKIIALEELNSRILGGFDCVGNVALFVRARLDDKLYSDEPVSFLYPTRNS